MIKKSIILFIFIFTSFLFAQSDLKLPDIIIFNPDSSKIRDIQILSLEKNIAGITYIPLLKLSREIFLPPKQKMIVNPVYRYKNYKLVDTYFDISAGNENFVDMNIKNIVNFKSFINNFSLAHNHFDNFYFNKLDKSTSIINDFQFINKESKFDFNLQYYSNKNVISNEFDNRMKRYSLLDDYYIDYKLFNANFKYNYKDYHANVDYQYSENNISDDEFYKDKKLSFNFGKPFKFSSYIFGCSLSSDIDFVDYRYLENTKDVTFFSTFMKIAYENSKYRFYLKPFVFTSPDRNEMDMYFGFNYFIRRKKWLFKFILLRDNYGDFHNREFSKSVYYSSLIYYRMNFPQANNLIGFSFDFLNYLNLYTGYLYVEDFINIHNVSLRYAIRNITNAKFLFSRLQFSYKGEYGEFKLLSKYYNPISNDIFLVPLYVGEVLFKIKLKDYNIPIFSNIELFSLLSYYSKFKLGIDINQNSAVFWDIEFIKNINQSFFISCGVKNIFDNNFDYFLYTNRNYGRLFFLKLGYNIKWK